MLRFKRIYPHIQRNTKKFASELWSFLFAESCLGCKEKSTFLCFECLSARQDIIETEPGFLSLFPYQNQTIKRALWFLKYRNRRDVALCFAPFLFDAILGEISEENIHFGTEYQKEKILLVPIPLFQKNKRSYNHAGVLAESIAEQDDQQILEVRHDILQKNFKTTPQVQMKNKSARLKNPHGSFRVRNPEQIKTKNIIVVDDVTTTGATLREARRVLAEAGAKKITCLTVAH